MSIFLAHNHKMLKSAGRYVGWVRNPLPPLGANSLRIKWVKGDLPKVHKKVDSFTCVDPVDNIWDITYDDPNWQQMLNANSGLPDYDDKLLEILDGNLQNVTNLIGFCAGQYRLKHIWNLNTSDNLTIASSMCYGCTSLTSVPLIETSGLTNVNHMFYGCENVESGALALYQRMSGQSTPPSSHDSTFYNCGSNTTTGSAELAQIPSSWK